MIPPYSSSYSATKSYIYICIYIHMEILYSPCYPHTYATQMHASPRYCSWVARVKTLEAHARGNQRSSTSQYAMYEKGFNLQISSPCHIYRWIYLGMHWTKYKVTS